MLVQGECINMEEKVVKIINEMAEYLNVSQMKKLQEVLLQTFSEEESEKMEISNQEYLQLFLDAKRIEGCSERTIHKIKTKQQVKETISDEAIEQLRDNCNCQRDLAIIDLLYLTGIRVGELVNLNISDIDFEARECVVFGKGDKERRVYFDAKAKIHLQAYLSSRKDDNPALFVTLDAPFDRLKISGVEIRIRQLGRNNLQNEQQENTRKFEEKVKDTKSTTKKYYFEGVKE